MSGRVEPGLDTARAVLARVGMALPATRIRAIAGIVWSQLRTRSGALAWTVRREPGRHALAIDVCWSMAAGLGMVDSLLGAYFSGRGVRLALAHGSPLQIARVTSAASIGASLLGRAKRSHALLAAARRAAEQDGTPLAVWYPGLAATASEFLVHNDWRRCRDSALALERDWYAGGRGPGWETDVAMHFSLAAQQMLGDYRELARRNAAFIHDAKRKGDLFQEVTLRVRFAVCHLLADRADVARADVDDALASWLPGSDSFGNQRAWALWSRTRIEIYAGELDALERTLDVEWRRMHRSLVGRIPLMRLEWYHAYATYLLGRAIAARKRGRPSETAALCRAADAVADRYTRYAFPAGPTAEMLIRAAIAWVRGGGDVIASTRRALDTAIESGTGAFAAFTKRRLGEAIGGSEGETLVSEADDEARRAGFVDPERAAELAIPTGRYS